jgi:hypothetical protein
MKKMKFFAWIFVYYCLFMGTSAFAQSLVEDANLSKGSESENVFQETIKIISASKKIFILTNNNQQLGPGDFISLALENNLAARAVVAKTHQGQVGIKILKIYSLSQWGRLRRNMEVQIIRGDDSYFGKKPEVKPEEGTIAKIKSEEDLYTGDVIVNDDVDIFEENKHRHIKPDNLVALTGSYLDAQEARPKSGTARATEIGISWAYQFSDNYFAEGLYGWAMIDNFPADRLQTSVNHLTARLKYNIKGPLYTFFMPYVGYHSYTVNSPDAGTSGIPNTDREQIKAVDKLKKSGPIFGVTALRRLVPGWFIKADLGTDIINVGFAIEF